MDISIHKHETFIYIYLKLSVNSVASQHYPPPPPKSDLARNIVIIVLVIVLMIVAAVVIGSLGSGGGGINLVPRRYTVNIVNGLITVPPGGYEYYEFTVPSCASNARVYGSFLASGGSGNDIIVDVMDQTNFINWENGHQAYAYYTSGQVTTGTINAYLQGGNTYYLVYDNTFSVFSTKNVQTTVNLYYTC